MSGDSVAMELRTLRQCPECSRFLTTPHERDPFGCHFCSWEDNVPSGERGVLDFTITLTTRRTVSCES